MGECQHFLGPKFNYYLFSLMDACHGQFKIKIKVHPISDSYVLAEAQVQSVRLSPHRGSLALVLKCF